MKDGLSPPRDDKEPFQRNRTKSETWSSMEYRTSMLALDTGTEYEHVLTNSHHIEYHNTKNKTISMPLTLTVTEGVLSKAQATTAVQKLSHAMLNRHGLTGNTVMTPNITANVVFIEKGLSFSGGEPFRGVWIEWKVPNFAFASEEVQKGYGQDASAIIQDLTKGKQPIDNVYFNVVHSVNGAWALDGKAMTNKELTEAISSGAL